jgi:RpiR family carbohydrate utilization transcriptional regulator
MLRPLQILDDIRRQAPHLKPSEAQVADMVLEDPRKVLGLNITALAQAAGVSEATVVRFCRSVGCAGFPDFKLRLAECQARGTPFVSQDVAPDDDPPVYARKIFSTATAALNNAAERLDIAAVTRAVELLSQAPRVLCVGMGASGALAEDAAHKFLRLGMDAQACTDPLLGRMLAVNLGSDGVLVVISNTGRSVPIVEMAQVARDQGASVIALTVPGSPLARVAGTVIGNEPVEDAEIFTPMASRLVQLTIVDVLSTGVALTLGAPARRHLAKVKAVLADTRIPFGSD